MFPPALRGLRRSEPAALTRLFAVDSMVEKEGVHAVIELDLPTSISSEKNDFGEGLQLNDVYTCA